jgi:hypothetical protein
MFTTTVKRTILKKTVPKMMMVKLTRIDAKNKQNSL